VNRVGAGATPYAAPRGGCDKVSEVGRSRGLSLKSELLLDDTRVRLHRWFRQSRYYGGYTRLFRPAYYRATMDDTAFYHALFTGRRSEVVYDVGANVGDKTELLRHFAKRVVTVEADPDLAVKLRHRFRRRPEVAVQSVAVGDRVGHANLRRKQHSGFNTLSEKWESTLNEQNLKTTDVVTVAMTTLDELIKVHGIPDYIKIDVEGFELHVISGLTVPIPMLSFECNLPTFRSETEEVVDRLIALDSKTLFNARLGDSRNWILPAPSPAHELRRLLNGSDCCSYEVFSFSSVRA
jgi:FkbM family methyltransferase